MSKVGASVSELESMFNLPEEQEILQTSLAVFFPLLIIWNDSFSQVLVILLKISLQQRSYADTEVPQSQLLDWF